MLAATLLGLIVLAHILGAAITTDPSNFIWISGVVGLGLPHVIALVNQEHWRPGLKSIVAFASCIGAALIVTWAKGDFDFHNIAASAGVIYALAQVSYKGLWKPTGTIDALEASTTLGTGVPKV
jgi:hypothetical protein